ncbi:glycerophosphotransferase [Robertmurraya yapensis]|uniref:Glycerophosphotransferase n=1 Tax=Bacillus yapensis TaxID=2492960 RepID=A0A431W3J8_9BACI|nr:CDP-glycerol glycerophosphotransferase family protein [Bacillus yapensis]RTR30008.1 glycerophosphotransferase [Bacillus yapensis]TKS95089.1 glycerophosphotransferase [Bacillus yapensis]
MKVVLKVKSIILLAIVYVFNFFPIKHNKIFLLSYYGDHFGCNPKYITKYILENYPKETFDIVWAFNNPDKNQSLHEFRVVKTMSLQYFYELCTSRVVITNFRTTDLYRKRKDQYYIQTWHSSLRLKQIEKDAQDSLPIHYVDMAKKDSIKCDLLLSGCEYSTKIFKNAFWYDGEIFEYGTPRNDFLFQQDAAIKKNILHKLQLPQDKKIILYAPTFRKKNSLDVYDLNYRKVLQKLEEHFGGEWILLIKLHPHLVAESEQLDYGEKVINVSNYDDIQELLYVSDILCTDYSSLMFDFSITGRPCFLYVPDLKEYLSNDRKLYFELSELPFVAAQSNEELIDKIVNFNHQQYLMELNQFLLFVGSFEQGNACEQLVKRISKVCYGREEKKVYETA